MALILIHEDCFNEYNLKWNGLTYIKIFIRLGLYSNF